MNTSEFAREIERANRRLVELRRAIRSEPPTAWTESALAELSSALEELKVAEEELSSQNHELAEANAEAEFERHRYQELFMVAPFAQVVTDLKGTITEANRAAADLFGVPAATLAGKPLPLFIALAERERFTRWVAVLKDASHDASVCAECGGAGLFEVQTAPRGRQFPAEVHAAPLSDRLGRIQSIRWCVRDVTDQSRARIAERLIEEARRKDEFLAVLGHELRNPLAAISLASEILTAQPGDADRKRWAGEVVQRHAEQLRRLVDDLLDVSRVSHGKITLQTADVDLRDVVEAALESCQPILQAKEHEVAVALPAEPALVRGDGPRLRQAVANLLDNAAKYTPTGGQIDVELASEGGQAVMRVRDTGIGIASHMLERIFGVFEQGEDTDPGERGLGIGLALVHQLVGLHGGTVEATSAGEGQGSTFVVRLPAAGAAASTAEAGNGAAARPHEAANEMARVLIVDDNVDAAELLAEKLRKVGYLVDVAYEGGSGLALARRARCQVALVDIGLPDLDGFEVCRALKSALPDLSVVALTGFSDERSRDGARQAGFDRFLVKPLDPKMVVAAVAELVGRPRGS